MWCNKEFWSYTIEWCRNWLPVTKVVFYVEINPSSANWYEEYSDWGTATEDWDWWLFEWKEWQCNQWGKDPEVLCLTNDLWETVIRWYVIFDTSTDPVTTAFFDFWWTELVWYTPRDCDTDLESDWEEFCDNWTPFIRRFVKENGEPTWDTFDTTLTWATYVASGSEIKWSCENEVSIIWTETLTADASVQVLSPPTWAVYAIGQILNGSIVFTVDWSTPVEWTVWYIEACKFILEFAEEIVNFKAIASAETNSSSVYYITYYNWIVDTWWL